MTDQTHESRDLLGVAVTVARRAADLVREQRAEGISGLGTKSTITDLVTAADRAAERLIVDLLRGLRPADQFLGEESGSHTATDRPPTGVRWLVDPIDGTVNYVYGLPQYAVSIAAEEDGQAVAGVVRNAVSGEEWTAIRGGGAWRDGRRLAGSGATDLARALVATGFAYDAGRRARQAGVVARLLPVVRDIRRLGRGVAGPLLRGRGSGRCVLRAGASTLGQRRRRPHRGRGGPARDGTARAGARTGDGPRRASGAAPRPARPAGQVRRGRRPLTAEP